MGSNLRFTACPLDCPDACTLQASVDEGRVTALTGDTRNRLTQGFICRKVRAMAGGRDDAARIRTPAVRSGPKGSRQFTPVSWEQAIDRIARELATVRDRHGGEAILPFSYGGSNGALTEGMLDARLFRRLGASELQRTICAAATTAAHDGLYGSAPGVDINDYADAQLIVVWGFNPHASGIHLVPIIKRARARGAKLVVVDPRATALARQADLHLPVRPGTDIVLALGLINWLFAHNRADFAFLDAHTTGYPRLRARAASWTLERAAAQTGLSAADIDAFARLYAESSPAVIRCGWGPERNRNGGSAVAAILALPAVAGKFCAAGGFTMSQSRTFRWRTEHAVDAPRAEARTVNMNKLGEALLRAAPPVHALFVYNANPLATVPDQNAVRAGLAREDLFTVVFDPFHTDTADYADVVLPATTFLEHHDLTRGYGATVLNRIRPVCAPFADARPNYAVFAELLRKLDLAQPGDDVDPDSLAQRIVETVDRDTDVHAALATAGAIDDPRRGHLFVDRNADTEDGKVHLCPAALDEASIQSCGMPLYSFQADPCTETFPLAMISPASAKTVSSTFGHRLRGPATAQVHPDDARARAVSSGDRIRIFNAAGEVHCRAEVTEQVRPGVVALAKGLWCMHTDNGRTSNALCPTSLTDLGDGATFNDARVQVERMAAQVDV